MANRTASQKTQTREWLNDMTALASPINHQTAFIDVAAAAKRLDGVVNQTPLLPNLTYGNLLGAEILLKREDLQTVRSYKIRGAYNKIAALLDNQPEL